MAIIASVAAILLLISGVTLPLFRQARSELISSARLPKTLSADQIAALGVDYGLDGRSAAAYALDRRGRFAFVNLLDGSLLGEQHASKTPSDARTLVSVERHAGSRLSLLWSDGSTGLVEVKSAVSSDGDGKRQTAFTVRRLAELPPEKEPLPLLVALRQTDASALTRVAILPGNRVAVLRQVSTENLAGDTQVETHRLTLEEPAVGLFRTLAVNQDGSALYVGTGDGRLIRWQLTAAGQVAEREIVPAFTDQRAITALAMLLGDTALAVGDAHGAVTVWFPVREQSRTLLRQVHSFGPYADAVAEIIPSARNKALLSRTTGGAVHLDYTTSERRLLAIDGLDGAPLLQAGLGLRGDAVLGLSAAGRLAAWRIDCPHPEVSLGTLFGKVFYEGYSQPEYVWQTTGSEDSEPKFSLVPLLFGTCKGTLYAMCLAVPLALLGAIYTSHFTTPGLKSAIKPVVEIMAAVPSVVVGFLVALWLAPLLESSILAVLLSVATLPLVFLALMVFWAWVRSHSWAKHVERGYEFAAVLPALLLGVALAVAIAPAVERLLFDGNFRAWLFGHGLRYDQRNSVLIAFGLGFTVIPIIFSIAEDALSNVPHSMTAASLALGASRWQTVWRVVLPSAGGGIFAAIMIGFGRAVGETMIILMATGNTPILDWSPFNGMRTFSANIAVEIPEAPVGGTLYRVLFLCAVLLFLLTFLLNTAAELVRQRLRKRYGRF